MHSLRIPPCGAWGGSQEAEGRHPPPEYAGTTSRTEGCVEHCVDRVSEPTFTLLLDCGFDAAKHGSAAAALAAVQRTMRTHVLRDDATILRDLVDWGVLPANYAAVYGSAALDEAARLWCRVRPTDTSVRGRINAPAGSDGKLPSTPQRAAAVVEKWWWCTSEQEASGSSVRAADVKFTKGKQMDAWIGVLMAYDICQWATSPAAAAATTTTTTTNNNNNARQLVARMWPAVVHSCARARQQSDVKSRGTRMGVLQPNMEGGLPGAKLLHSRSELFTDCMRNSAALAAADGGALWRLLDSEARRLRDCEDCEAARGTPETLLQRLRGMKLGPAALKKLWTTKSSTMAQLQPAVRCLLRPPAGGFTIEQHGVELTRLFTITDAVEPGTSARLLQLLRAFSRWAAQPAGSCLASAFLTAAFDTAAIEPDSDEEQRAHASIRALRALAAALKSYVPRSRLVAGLPYLPADDLREFLRLFRRHVHTKKLSQLAAEGGGVPEPAFSRLVELSVAALTHALERERAPQPMEPQPITPGGELAPDFLDLNALVTGVFLFLFIRGRQGAV